MLKTCYKKGGWGVHVKRIEEPDITGQTHTEQSKYVLGKDYNLLKRKVMESQEGNVPCSGMPTNEGQGMMELKNEYLVSTVIINSDKISH